MKSPYSQVSYIHLVQTTNKLKHRPSIPSEYLPTHPCWLFLGSPLPYPAYPAPRALRIAIWHPRLCCPFHRALLDNTRCSLHHNKPLYFPQRRCHAGVHDMVFITISNRSDHFTSTTSFFQTWRRGSTNMAVPHTSAGIHALLTTSANATRQPAGQYLRLCRGLRI